MKSSTAMIGLILLSTISGCMSSSSEDEIGCPDNPPDGADCAIEEYGHFMFGSGVDFSGKDLSDGNFTDAILVNANFTGADLRGADFEGANIRGADFSGADILGASFSGAIFDSQTIWGEEIGKSHGMLFLGPGANLDGAILDGQMALSWAPAFETAAGNNFPMVDSLDLSGASLVGASIRDSWIFVADFSGSDLTGANFFGSDMIFVNLSNADLSGANLSGISGVYLDLSGADLTGAELYDFSARYLRGCPSELPEGWGCLAPDTAKIFDCGSEKAFEDEHVPQGWADEIVEMNMDMSICNYLLIGPTFDFLSVDWDYIDGFNLSGIDLSVRPPEGISAVNLTGCPSSLFEGYICTGGTILGPKVRMFDVNLSGIDLSGADLSGAVLVGVDLSDANLADANFEGAMWSDTTCPDGTNSDDNEYSCENNL
tara:strand:+ start:565 stop:1854 length:1290 start_codon:yes stop_codon:yes gene_type:complete